MRDEPERARLHEYSSEEGLRSFFFFSSLFFPFASLSLFRSPFLCLSILVPVEQLLYQTNNCCVWASTSSLLSQTTRWLCRIQCDGIESHLFFSFSPLFFNKRANRLQDERNCRYHSHVQEESLQGKVLLSCKSKVGFGIRVFYSKSLTAFISNSMRYYWWKKYYSISIFPIFSMFFKFE